MKQFLESGKIVNTHGVKGDIKIQPWSNSPEFLTQIKTIYVDEIPYHILKWKIQKECLLATVKEIDSLEKALHFKNKIVYINRDDVKLDEGEYFIQDIIGFDVIDDDRDAPAGKLKDVLQLPAGNVYVVQGDREILVPVVPEFIRGIELEAGTIRVHFIEGM